MSAVTIRVSLWDSGCLPGLLSREIANQERHMRVCGDRYSSEDHANAEAYLGQLRACLEAAIAARRQEPAHV